MPIRAVFFDAGSTLIYPEPSVGEAYARALRRAGVQADGQEMGRRFQEAWRRLRAGHPPGALEYGTTEAEAFDWWRRVVRECFVPFGPIRDFERVFRELWDHFAAAGAWRVYDDVLPTFDALERRGVGIGLISNWDVRLPLILRGLGLADRLRWQVVSCDVGVEKPDPAIFVRALELSGLAPEEAAHVGDSLALDARAAREAGMMGIWLRRDYDGDDCPAGVACVTTLTAVPDLPC